MFSHISKAEQKEKGGEGETINNDAITSSLTELPDRPSPYDTIAMQENNNKLNLIGYCIQNTLSIAQTTAGSTHDHPHAHLIGQ